MDQRTGEQKLFLLEGQTSCQSHIHGLGRRSEPLVDHVDVYVNQDSPSKVHSFDIDRKLGELIDNGSMQSKLVLVQLHGHTLSCMPDILTQRTGTEEALTILQSAAMKFFSRLTLENIDMLARIANQLTPKRAFYPLHERVMQTVQWSSDLSFMSQQAGFYVTIASILEHAKRYDELFFQSGDRMPDIHDVDTHLLERDRIRSAAFYVSGYGAEYHTPEWDVEYNPRDRQAISKKS